MKENYRKMNGFDLKKLQRRFSKFGSGAFNL